MSLYSTTHRILELGRKQPNVFEAGEGSIYDYLNGRMDVAYPVVVVTQQQHIQDMMVAADFDTWTFQIFYVDRLTSDKDNRLEVQSTAIEALKNIIRGLEKDTQIVSNAYTTFTERFESMCAGAYAELSLLDLTDTICEDEFNTILTKIYYHTLDNSVIDTHGVSGWGDATLVYNRAVTATEFYHEDGSKYPVNGELIFYGVPTDVPENSLYGNDELDAIYLPSTITALGNNAFSFCPHLRTIGGDVSTANIESYGFYVFHNDSEIGSGFTFGTGITFLDSRIFNENVAFPDDTVRVRMNLEDFLKSSRSNEWCHFSTYNKLQFNDTLVEAHVDFHPEDIYADTSTVTLSFESNMAPFNGFFWEAYCDGRGLFNNGWSDVTSDEMSEIVIGNIPYNSTEQDRNIEVYAMINGHIAGVCSFKQLARTEGGLYFQWLLAPGEPMEGTYSADTTSLEMQWMCNTNTQPWRLYKDYKLHTQVLIMSGVSYNSGDDYGHAVMTFPANTDTAKTLDYTLRVDPNLTLNAFTRTFHLLPAVPVPVPVEYHFSYVNPQGQVLASSATQYDIAWRTDSPSVDWVLFDGRGAILGSGTTSESGMTVTFPANEDTGSTIGYKFAAATPSNINYLYWTLAEAEAEPEPGPEPPDTGVTYEFAFNNVPDEHLASSSTSNTVTWTTNYPSIDYGYFNEGNLLRSGHTMESGMTVTFPANTDSANTVEYNFIALDPLDGMPISALTWYVDVADAQPEPGPEPPDTGETYYFSFLNEQGQLLASSTTANTVAWDTNYPSVDYGFIDANNQLVLSGTTSESAITVTFPANTDTGFTPMYGFSVQTPDTYNYLYWLLDLAEAQPEPGPDSGVTPDTGETIDPYASQYLTFEIVSAGTFQFTSMPSKYTKEEDFHPHETLEYSMDSGDTWNTLNRGVDLNVVPGDRIMVRGDYKYRIWNPDNSRPAHRVDGMLFSGSTSFFNIEGNPYSLIFSSGFTSITRPSEDDTLYNHPCSGDLWGIFRNSHVISAEHLSVPILQSNVCEEMFRDCVYLTTAPTLNYKEVGMGVFAYMFAGCTALVNAPELPATQVGYEAYYAMFSGCTALVNGPSVLPAKVAPNNCYESMFFKCTSLVNAPVIEAELIFGMGCKRMFAYCRNLSYIKCMAKEVRLANDGGSRYEPSTIDWVWGVSSEGTFVKHPDYNWDNPRMDSNDGIPVGWTVEDAVI